MDPLQGPQQPDLLIGQTIGNYLVTQRLGEGGMGAVYLAEHPSIGKKVALKVLHSEFSTNQEVTARFFHEAKAVNDIGHPNIVDIVDFGILQAGGGREQLVYFIMEYLAGLTLSQLIRNEAPLPPERALSIALQVADALSASHKCGIVHRDLKPDNIILLQRGRERDFVKLLDFGIAKLTGGSAMGSHRTRTGIVMGTPAYMSPEQCEGRDSVDLRTDIYALGIVLYEMLTGRVPFVGEGYGEILVQHLTQRPVPPSQFRMLQAHVEVVVLKALEKRADMRYPTMDEFIRAMSDPVGYVEAHGGVSSFLQRQLMPSNAPLPTGKLTPAPLTPLPGTLIAPSVPGVAPSMPGVPPSMSGVSPSMHGVRGNAPSVPGMPGVPGVATPAPTTLGSATGQVRASRSKTGYILAGLVIAAAAVAAIIAVAGKDKVAAGTGSDGSAVIANGGSGDTGSSATTGGTTTGGTTAGGATGDTTAGGATGGTTAGGTTGGTTSGGAIGGTTAGGTTAGGTTGGATGGTTAGGTAGGTTAGGTTAGGTTGGGTIGGTTAGGTTAGGTTGGTTTGGAIGGTMTGGTTAGGTSGGTTAGGTSGGTTAGGTSGGTTAGGTSGGTTAGGTSGGTTAGGTTGGGTTAGGTTGGTTAGGATGGTTAGGTTGGATGGATVGGTTGGTTTGGTTAGGTTGGAIGGTTTGGAAGRATGGTTTGTGKTTTPTLPEETEIGVSSTPSGARIYVDNVDTGKITPAKLSVPHKRSKSISITLRLKGYDQFTFKAVDVDEPSQQRAELVKIKAAHPATRCRTAERAGCKRDSNDCCLPDSGSKPPGKGSGAGSSDSDDLMRP